MAGKVPATASLLCRGGTRSALQHERVPPLPSGWLFWVPSLCCHGSLLIVEPTPFISGHTSRLRRNLRPTRTRRAREVHVQHSDGLWYPGSLEAHRQVEGVWSGYVR